MDIYSSYQLQDSLLAPVRVAAGMAAPIAGLLAFPGPIGIPARQIEAGLDIFSHSGISHERPKFGINQVGSNGRLYEVADKVVCYSPFCDLRHFEKIDAPPQPKMLIIAPMSGHFATLLRETVRTSLQNYDVYITDWRDARDIPVDAGRFGLDEYIDHIILFQRRLGVGVHTLAVCQPTVAALAATAIMAEDKDPSTPISLTIMGGPIDTRIKPSQVNHLAKTKDLQWFKEIMIDTVPYGFSGTGRKVYPGYIQLASFMSMNLDRHISAHLKQFRSIVTEDAPSVVTHRKFYDEYQTVMDLPAEFYIETISKVFQEHDLPNRKFYWRDRLVNLDTIEDTFLFTVEGERDDICPPGQTDAALDLCGKLQDEMKFSYIQPGVGHYGLFNGKRWSNEIFPKVCKVTELADQYHQNKSAPGLEFNS